MQRIGISMSDRELARLGQLQKRFGVRSRSELVRELISRFEKLEARMKDLSDCLRGYVDVPESSEGETRSVLGGAIRHQTAEDWSE